MSPITLPQDFESTISKAVDDLFDQQIKFLKTLISHPSTRGNEISIQNFLEEQLHLRNFDVENIPFNDKLQHHPYAGKISKDHSKVHNLHATLTPLSGSSRNNLILNHHVDVVPTGPEELWSNPPFSPTISEDGKYLYGRGSGDMKAGISANIFALDALKSIGYIPASIIQVHSVVEEESTGNGTLMLHLEDTYKSLVELSNTGGAKLAAIIPEPEDEKLVRSNVGVLWFTVYVSGTAVHVRDMQTGSNAIDAAYRIISSLRELEIKWNAKKGQYSELFANAEKPINLNIGKIEGGDWASSVPSWCKISCRVGIYPGVKAQDAADEITSHVRDFCQTDNYLKENPAKVEFDGFFSEGFELEPSEAEDILAEAHGTINDEKSLERFMTAGYLDTRVHVLYDKIPSLCYGPKSENIHGVDEKVDLESLKRVTKVIALFIAKWCGLEEFVNQN